MSSMQETLIQSTWARTPKEAVLIQSEKPDGRRSWGRSRDRRREKSRDGRSPRTCGTHAGLGAIHFRFGITVDTLMSAGIHR